MRKRALMAAMALLRIAFTMPGCRRNDMALAADHPGHTQSNAQPRSMSIAENGVSSSADSSVCILIYFRRNITAMPGGAFAGACVVNEAVKSAYESNRDNTWSVWVYSRITKK